MKHRSPWTGILPFILLASLYIMGCDGCENASVKLEFDRMTGTAFPTTQTRDGEDWTLPKIYAPHGVLLVVDEDDTAIPALTGAYDPADPDQYDYITPAEMDNLMATYRTLPVEPTSDADGDINYYYCYGIVLDHWYEKTDGTRSTGVLGVMWDTSDRSAFAIFYKHGTISSDGQKYLRTTAHELGHAFNLHHSFASGDSTIMTQTADLITDWVYKFSETSADRIENDPASCSRPGTGVFSTTCP